MTVIQPMSSLLMNTTLNVDNGTKSLTGAESFEYALNAAKELIQTNKDLQDDVSTKTIDFMTGKNDNIVDLMVAQEKSSILLQYTMQLRSGLMSAYKEITNIQV